MPVDVKTEVWNKCDVMGIDHVRAMIRVSGFGSEQVFAIEWVDVKEREVRERQEAEESERAKRALKAAEQSASASRDAAKGARAAARWTMVAALATAAAVIVALKEWWLR